MNFRLTTYLLLLVSTYSFSQDRVKSGEMLHSYQLVWGQPVEIKVSETEKNYFLSFIDAQYDLSTSFLPRFSAKVPLADNSSFVASLINPIYEDLSSVELPLIKRDTKIASSITIETSTLLEQKRPYGNVSFVPIRKNKLTGNFEKLISFDLSFSYSQLQVSSLRSTKSLVSNSVLKSGDWYKISIANDGIHKLTYSFFEDLGIDVSTINPVNIRFFGNGGGMLSELNSDARPDDLLENAIYVFGQDDNVFDEEDYVLFYGKGPNTWSFDSTACPQFTHSLNMYSDSAYYFISFDLGAGKRIASQTSTSLPATHTVTSFDDYSFHEYEGVNFLKSGRHWYGEYFENNPTHSFSFSFPNIDQSEAVTVKANIASRNFSSTSLYSVGSQSGSTSISISSTTDNYYSNYAIIGSGCYSFNPTSSSVTVDVTKQTSNAIAWLDYIEVQARRQLQMSGNQMSFRDVNSFGSGNVATYNLTSSIPVEVWEITDITNVKSQSILNSGTTNSFSLSADEIREFIAFDNTSFYTPVYAGKVENQDLHSLSNYDFIIVTHPDFYTEALRLAAHHENVDTLSTIVVTAEQIYNEFSSGTQDISAIRDFMKMLYDKASTTDELPQYLLLFGDGSYDNKNRLSGNTNFVPTYQSENSTLVTASYVSDDFYGLLDDGEGLWISDAVDIGIGRFPVKTIAEAQIAVDKVLNYTKTGISSSLNSSFGSWRNSICFIGDDEDGALHTTQADQLATLVDTTYGNYNIDKIYLDAYNQEARPGGNRYPDVVEAINNRIDRGVLIINYTGHGGELGLAHERIVDVSQVNNWENKNKLFLFYTASCEVSRYDDPARTSAGEYAFLNPNGGAIALFSTVRVVYASPNFYLNRNFFLAAFEPINGKMPRLGDLYKYSKNQSGGNSVNSRNFTLLGDPALTLAYPKYTIVTDSINHIAISTSSFDTISALSLVTVSGHVNNQSASIMSDFAGVLYPTVFDKSQDVATLSNDGTVASPQILFKLQKNVLYNGKVSVEDGRFIFSFVVPKDIAYQYGVGRISYYADDGYVDASGYYENVIVGGSNDSADADELGPEVDLYMNDTKFVFGGLTDENPDLYSVLVDSNGINTVGSGIGHDIMATLDGDEGNGIILNDYYQSDLNSYKSGTIRYPFSDISEGSHNLKLKVWDVYNNSSESYTEFVVAQSAELALSHVLNYPNPFTTKTEFYFEHNQPNSILEVQLQVFTISGRLVKNITQFINAGSYRSDPIAWDGRDDYGDKIGRGVYVYKIKVKSADGSFAEKYEKLVILN